jgi:hypothetical protein
MIDVAKEERSEPTFTAKCPDKDLSFSEKQLKANNDQLKEDRIRKETEGLSSTERDIGADTGLTKQEASRLQEQINLLTNQSTLHQGSYSRGCVHSSR